MNLRSTIALFAGLLLLSGAATQAPSASAGTPENDIQDIVYFADSKPLLIRLHIQTGGKPFRAGWDEAMKTIFAYLDVNGDGVLDKTEASRVPPAQLLLQGGFFGRGGLAAPTMEVLDENKDGKVSPAELARYYRKNGLASFQLQDGGGGMGFNPIGNLLIPGPTGASAEVLNKALFSLLDTNRDGKLSAAELAAAPGILLARDATDDEMISPDELLPDFTMPDQTFALRVNFPNVVGGQDTAGPFMAVHPGEPAPALAAELLKRYGPKGGPSAGSLRAADLGLDAASFVHLDRNNDGVLDAQELAGFNRRTPDVELLLRLGKRGGKEARFERIDGDGQALPPGVRLEKGADGSVSLQLGVVSVNLRAGDGPTGGSFRIATPQLRTLYVGQFKTADQGMKGYLTREEAMQNPVFRTTFQMMDRDGDGKLYEKEMLAYLDTIEKLQRQVQTTGVSGSFAEGSRGLFDLIDTNHDGRLSIREMRQMGRLLAELDRNKTGFLNPGDIPRVLTLQFGEGSGKGGGPNNLVLAANGRLLRDLGPRAAEPPKGPAWFRKMDRNRDGDVSRREFLGTDEQFRQIDTDGDGLISLEEAIRATEALKKEK